MLNPDPNAPFGAVLKTKRTLVWFKKTKRALGGVSVKPNAPLVGRGGSSGVVEVAVVEVMVAVVSVGWRWCCCGWCGGSGGCDDDGLGGVGGVGGNEGDDGVGGSMVAWRRWWLTL
ncbi:hypothetical protein Tco_0314779, partial [Tanacetum coccineum]